MTDQVSMELIMHPKHIKKDVKNGVHESFHSQITQAKQLITGWVKQPEYESKMVRKIKLISLNIYDIIVDIYTAVIMHCAKPIPYVSLASMVHIDGFNKSDSIKTVAELIALLKDTGIYEVSRRDSRYYVQSLVNLPEVLQRRIELSCYLPPMVERPKHIKDNHTSGYLTLNDSVLLGYKENQHNMPLALDVLNTLNSTAFELDEYIINNFKKDWHREELTDDEIYLLDTKDRNQYLIEKGTRRDYLEQFEVLKGHLKDRPFYFTNKYDKRGRIYTQGYHFSPQGTSFEKACINLKTKEFITGEL